MQYLRMDSCHPYHCKTSIPYSQALRLRRICSEEEHLLKWTRELKKHVLKRGYCEQQLNDEIHRALAISRENCLQLRPSQDKPARIPLVVTYHPILPSFQSITKRHLPTLQTSEKLRDAFLHPPLIAFRRPRNLRDLLVRASLNTIQNETPGNRPCGAAGCKTCPILTATDEFTSYKTGQKFKVKFAGSCRSSNIIYLFNYLQEVLPVMRKVVLAKTCPPRPVLAAKIGPRTNYGCQNWSPPDNFWQPKLVLPCYKWSRGGPILVAKSGPRDQFWLPIVVLGTGFGSHNWSCGGTTFSCRK